MSIPPTLGRVVVIIPTYNELENLPLIVGRVRAATPGADILVVDDNSPDGTGRLADQMAAQDRQIQVLHRTTKDGLGGAYIAGFKWAIAAGYDVMCEMDADGSHRPEELPWLLDALQGADLVIGSRWTKGGKVHNWPKNREILSRGGNTYIGVILRLGIKDATAGFRAFRRATLEKIGLDEVDSRGYCFQVDMSRRTVQAGLHVVEVPINFVEREIGDSKMSGNIIGEAMVNVTKWGLSDLFRGKK
ncbi:polyprenol monophosphomannose synthase [Actinocorallia lasiicapitis]